MKIVEYTALHANDFVDLGAVVNKFIQAGWQPLGGVSTHKDYYVFQAMVKYEEPPKQEPTTHLANTGYNERRSNKTYEAGQ